MKILSFVLGMVLGLSLVSAFAGAAEPRSVVICGDAGQYFDVPAGKYVHGTGLENLNMKIAVVEKQNYTQVSAPSIAPTGSICVTVSKPAPRSDGPAERPACQPAR